MEVRPGSYVLQCHWCDDKILTAWRCAWIKEDPDRRWEPFCWTGGCLEQYTNAMELEGLTVGSRGVPYFRVPAPFMAWQIDLGAD